jgi:hypothetical protein
MKYADLIRAALDGKTIQYQYLRTKNPIWIDIIDPASAIRVLAGESPHYEYRIKPDPKPDVVNWGVVTVDSEAVVKHWLKNDARRYLALIKMTTNGETDEQTMEIVK